MDSLPMSFTSNAPPGPWKLPLLGNIHQLAFHLPHCRLADLAKTYGPIMSVQLGEVPAVVISSVEAAKEVLKTQEKNFVERPSVLAAEIVLYNRGDMVFSPYGEYSKQMKKICTMELLNTKRVQSFKAIREEEVSDLVKFLYSEAGSPVDLSKHLFSMTNSIVTRTSVGKKCKKQEAFLKVVDEVIEAAGGFSVSDVFPSVKFLSLINGMSSKLHRIHREADEILEEMIQEHKANKGASSENDVNNLLQVLLDIQERGDHQFHFTTDNIKAIILDMFIAASDTSSKTAEWAISELVRNPRVMKIAQEEVRRVFAEKGNVDESGIQDLPYLKLIMKETLRLHPPVALIPRECNHKSQIHGFDIYPKTKVMINAWNIGRDANTWADPERFYPERFAESSVDYKGQNFELIPFGAGRRMCPGIAMGIANVELPLAQLLYHFDWQLPDGAHPESLDMSESFGAAVKRKFPLILVPTPIKMPSH